MHRQETSYVIGWLVYLSLAMTPHVLYCFHLLLPEMHFEL